MFDCILRLKDIEECCLWRVYIEIFGCLMELLLISVISISGMILLAQKYQFFIDFAALPDKYLGLKHIFHFFLRKFLKENVDGMTNFTIMYGQAL